MSTEKTAIYKGRKPVYVLYLASSQIPRRYHKEMGAAIGEAKRLASTYSKPAYIIEYGDEPVVLGHVTPEGEVVQKNLAA